MPKFALFVLSCTAGIAVGVSLPVSHKVQVKGTGSNTKGRSVQNEPLADFKQQWSLLSKKDITSEEAESILIILRHALSKDPIACLNQLADLEIGGLVSVEEAIKAIIASQAGDITAAVTVTKSINDNRLRNRIQMGMFRELVATDPGTALEFLTIFPHDKARVPARLVIETLIAQSPEENIGKILSLKDFGRSAQYALEIWGEKSPEDALRYISDSTDSTVRKLVEDMPLVQGIFKNIISKNPEGALTAYASLPKNLQGEETLCAAYRALALASPEAFAAEMRKSDKSFVALRAAIDTLAHAAIYTPAEAERIAASLPSERARAEGYKRAAYNRVVTGKFKETADWLQEIQEPLVRQAAADVVARRWAGMAPAEAVKYATTNITNVHERNRFLDSIVRTWTDALNSGRVSPGERFLWADSLSEQQKKSLLERLGAGSSSSPQLNLMRDRLAQKPAGNQ